LESGDDIENFKDVSVSDLEQFREETSAWLEENCPLPMREPYETEDDNVWAGRKPSWKYPEQKIWMERMAERGWTAPMWPKAYGGGGLSPDEDRVLREEMTLLGCRQPLDSFGISMLGPAMLKYGNEMQRTEHLPQIVRGEIRWCQGYSEPGAGSDLASLQTRAEDRGDHYLVNGSKIWTSYADKADWIFALVRTDNSGSKHEGVSFLLFDMETAGVSTKPIQLISGYSPFCETFFDDVKVPKGNLMGEEGKAWTMAKYLMTHEREMISGTFGLSDGNAISELALKNLGSNTDGRLSDSVMRQEITQLQIDAMAFTKTLKRAKDETDAGGLGDASAIFKYYGTELNKRRHEINMSVNGADALDWDSEASNVGDIPRKWLRTKANSIEGGTSEVQLNIIAKRVLNLPTK
jgi:acyl-CoA dehydrogenase